MYPVSVPMEVMTNRKQPLASPTPLAISVAAVLILSPVPAAAYLGPGAGLSAIGAALALVAAICLAVVGFIWYPAKRLSRRFLGKGAPPDPQAEDDRSGGPRAS